MVVCNEWEIGNKFMRMYVCLRDRGREEGRQIETGVNKRKIEEERKKEKERKREGEREGGWDRERMTREWEG